MTRQYPLFFVQRFKGKVLFNVPMREYTSLLIGGPADVMAFPRDVGDLKELLQFANSKNYPVLILGSGTNLLARDGGIRGVVVNMTDGFKDITWQEESSGRAACIAGAGLSLARMVSVCTEKGLTGLEFACGIPGTLGGAAIMNAGAWGHEMKDVIEGVEILDRKGKKGFLSRSDLAFTYRSADIPEGAVVVRIHLRFEKKDTAEIRKTIKDYTERRKRTSDIRHPNAGSIFKNPPGHVAGKLVDEAGLKGVRSGDVQISEVHGNYIVNLGKARAKDVLSLISLVRDKIYATRGIVLEPEIKVVGED
ncbi:MAG: UDP-N-acetylmuramate dehydrogenase [Thermodesulfobacteriota bacterium]